MPNSTTGLLAAGVTWLTNPAPLSTLGSGSITAQPAGTAFFNAAAVSFVEFRADGSLNTGAAATTPYVKLVVTSGTLANNVPQFTNSAAVRGLLIRPTGAISFVNDAASF